MCKGKSLIRLFLVFLWLIIVIAAIPVLAEDSATPTDNPPTVAVPTTPPPAIDIQSLQQIPGGQGNLPIINPYTNEIINPSAYQPKEKTWWEKIYPYALDIAIGVGAALVIFGVIKLTQTKKSHKNFQSVV